MMWIFKETNQDKLEKMFLKRMKRKKWDRGGDGVSHHRYTSDGGRHDKCGPPLIPPKGWKPS